MVGFTKSDIPDDVENAVMIDFLQTEYPKLSLDEMKLAFKMGISGKFQVDASTYGKRFSPAYVARFINGYDQHKLNELKVAKQKEAYNFDKQVETPEDKKAIDEAIAKLKEKFVEPVDKLKMIPAKGFGETDYNHEKVISYEEAKFLSQNINPKTNE